MKARKFLKRNWLTIVGLALIAVGLSISGYDYITRLIEQKAIEQEMAAFFDSSQLIEDEGVTSEETVPEVVDDDLWGIIEIEKLGVYHPIIQSSNWNYLDRYVVAYERSPTPPNEGNFSIAGHNGRCASCVFRDFDQFANGDVVKLHDRDNTYIYSVYDNFIVDYTDISVLEGTENETTLTLITCVRQITNDTERRIIKARLVEVVPRS